MIEERTRSEKFQLCQQHQINIKRTKKPSGELGKSVWKNVSVLSFQNKRESQKVLKCFKNTDKTNSECCSVNQAEYPQGPWQNKIKKINRTNSARPSVVPSANHWSDRASLCCWWIAGLSLEGLAAGALRQSLRPVSHGTGAYRRGWCRLGRGVEAEAEAAASSASSSSWLTLDCSAAGVSHSLGRQLCRKGTHELK